MPNTVIKFLKQTAILWPSVGFDAYGQATVGSPVEIRVRWVTARTESLTPQGNMIGLDATAQVDRKIPIGSRMWLGTLADWYGTGSAGSDDELMEVKTYNETPDIKARHYYRQVGMMRYKQSNV